MNLGEKIVAEAFAAFDQWCKEHDPEGEMDTEQRVEAYGRWCDAGNKIDLDR